MKRWLAGKYFDLVFWWNKTKLERLLDAELRPYSSTDKHEPFQDDTERKYSEGLAIVKGKINSMVGTRSTENYKEVLDGVKELIALGTEETTSQRELRKIMTAMARLPEKSQKRMIDDRIGHYEELRKYNEERALIKQIKQARKEKDNVLAEELEQKWRDTYGKVRNPRRR